MALFVQAVTSNSYVERIEKTEYQLKTTPLRFWQKILPDHFRVVSVAQCFLNCLDELETVPEGGSSISSFKHLEWCEKIKLIQDALQNLKKNPCYLLLERIRSYVANFFSYFSISSSVDFLTIQDIENRLKLHKMAFEAFKNMASYIPSPLDSTDNRSLLTAALEWKKQFLQLFDEEFINPSRAERMLSDLETQRLEKAALFYPFFIDYILSPEGKAAASSFFSWVIKEGCDPAFFVLKPYTSKFLQQHLVSQKIGDAEKKTSKVFLKFNPLTAQFTLPLALRDGVVRVNACALDQTITFKEDSNKISVSTLTIKKAIQFFAKKHHETGPFAFTSFQPE